MLQHFTYLAPRTRAELHSVLANEGAAAALLAGGTDLLVNVRAGLAHPKVVVDTKKVEDFAGIAWSERDGLIIRAGATINFDMDAADKDRKIATPLLVLWGTRGSPPTDEYPTVWRKYASSLVDIQPLPSGHYLQEEQPDRVYDYFIKFFTA